MLEIQSLSPHSFTHETVKQLMELNDEITPPLRDAWLLECGWLARQARIALRNLWDDASYADTKLALLERLFAFTLGYGTETNRDSDRERDYRERYSPAMQLLRHRSAWSSLQEAYDRRDPWPPKDPLGGSSEKA